MIYKIALQGRVVEYSTFNNMHSAIKDLRVRNERAGRQVVVNEHTKFGVQFTLVYPQINRRVDGTISVYGKGVKLPVFVEDIVEDVERLLKEGKLRSEICRILSCQVKDYQKAKVLLWRQKRALEVTNQKR